MKTRAKSPIKPSLADEANSTKSSTTPKITLSPDVLDPPQLFILPKDISKNARILTMRNPRYSTDSRYLVCPERGFYEFKKVSAPKATPRSWLLSQDSKTLPNPGSNGESAGNIKSSQGYVTKSANLLIATPIDPLFLLLLALSPQPTSKTTSEPSKKLFLSGEEYFERLISSSSQLSSVIRSEPIRSLLEQRMATVCDAVDAGDEKMYRINQDKVLLRVMEKAQKMAKNGLPASMEDKLVRKTLEVPLPSVKRDESSLHELLKEEDESRISTPATESTDSQATMGTSESETSTAATSFAEKPSPEPKAAVEATISAPEGVPELLRLRIAFSFICASYLPSHMISPLNTTFSSESSPVDFSPLDNHLAYITKLRQEAVAARSLGDISRKRSLYDDDDEAEITAAKKRKKEEEEKKKKAGESRGVKNLKKVNVTGMKKMSDFFKKT